MQRLTRAEPDGHTIVFGEMGVLAAFIEASPRSGVTGLAASLRGSVASAPATERCAGCFAPSQSS